MRRLSIQLTCLLALLPALGLGCAAGSHEDSRSEMAYAAEHKSEDASVAMEPGGAARGDYDYAMDVADEAPASDDAVAPPSPAPMAEAEAGAMMGDGEGIGTGTGRDRSAAPAAKKATTASPTDAKGGKIAREEEDAPAKIAKRPDQNIQSGTLTAGSFDDNLNPWVFDKFVDQVRSHPDLSQLASAFAGQRTVLRVQDAQGRPVANAKVEIDGKQLLTRTDGRAVWVQGWDSGNQGQGKATISHGNTRKTVSIKDQVEQLVTLTDAQGSLPTKLDIALVIDATGSMGDEMEYLKVEIRDIAEAISRHFPNVDQRYALVVYRDNGDQYTTRVFDFTGDLDAFQRDLSAQSAGGGGDYPEAMDAAMKATEKLSCRKDGTARVTFLVADAPPHSNDIDDTLDAVDGLRKQGVAVYPVASSGVAGEAEFVMRAAAMLTGAQYLFLTDDSGVGNPHAEPHIPCYTVEQLAPLMVRAVRSELSGQRVEAEDQFTIRTVGKGQAGVCERPKPSAKIAR
ncbi:MAG TPA: vWA domain-containing protein [Enhygromyxa sp.]|nr:vWA domain-containing protein [Enhygromyxa sp.]